MNNRKRSVMVIPCMIAALLLMLLPASAFATEPNTEKEEVIYINLNGNGSIKDMFAVNIFELEDEGRIIDYGRYHSLRNMTTTDELHQSEDMVVIDAKPGKLYYEGKMDGGDMPWNISIRYHMDGQEYPAEEMAGKSGKLKITIGITENADCQGHFFDCYALQISLKLDTEKCRNIVAEDATVANVGSSKQLMYTVLPGQGGDYALTADVTDFEMEGFTIDGIPLNLNIEVSDDELMEKVSELVKAIEEMDGGAQELYDGVSGLQDGVQSDLQGGVQKLHSGAVQLYDGTAALNGGGSTLLAVAAELKNGSAVIDGGIQSLSQGVNQMQTAMNMLDQESPALTEGASAFRSALGRLRTTLDNISVTNEDLSKLRDASASIKTGVDKMLNDVTDLQQSVNFEAYKQVMSANGLDIDALKQNNAAAMSGLQSIIGEMNSQIIIMQANGADTSALEAQIVQLSNAVALFNANNTNISGMENYLTSVNQNLSALRDGVISLQTGYTAFDKEIGNLVNTLGTLTDQMGKLSAAVDTLVSEYEKLNGGISSYTKAVSLTVAGYSEMANGVQQLASGSGSLKKGAESLYAGIGELFSGVAEIYNGAKTLKDETGTLDDGVKKILTAIVRLNNGTGELRRGISSVREETSGMDTEINHRIDDLMKSLSGGSAEITSFVSPKNNNIKSVQFVIQTEQIRIPKNEAAVTEEEEGTGFFRKLLNLFGLSD